MKSKTSACSKNNMAKRYTAVILAEYTFKPGYFKLEEDRKIVQYINNSIYIKNGNKSAYL